MQTARDLPRTYTARECVLCLDGYPSFPGLVYVQFTNLGLSAV